MHIQQWNKQDDIFNGVLDADYKTRDYCDVFYVADKGFAVLNYQPLYGLYRRLDIPEIQDVFVLPEHRQQGIATALIKHCESVALAAGKSMAGISVPVSPQFGAAQCLYINLGYKPDGNGVSYERDAVIHNQAYPVDDNLCLMLIKELS